MKKRLPWLCWTIAQRGIKATCLHSTSNVQGTYDHAMQNASNAQEASLWYMQLCAQKADIMC